VDIDSPPSGGADGVTNPVLSMDDRPYREKATELLELLEADHVPPRIKLAVPRLSQFHDKLFVMVCEPSEALRADYLRPGIYPSNFLCELVEAVRAFEWPKVLSLVSSVTGQRSSVILLVAA
jgi:hypothetical protein